MPSSPLRPCATANCTVLVSRGHCPVHTTQINQRRRVFRHEAGFMTYCEPWWLAYRKGFIARIFEAGGLPWCGYGMPGGPTTALSRCRAQGFREMASRDGSSLHFHHEPPLTEAEHRLIKQGYREIACDDSRIVLLCRECHSTETMTGRTAQNSGGGIAIDRLSTRGDMNC